VEPLEYGLASLIKWRDLWNL